MFSKKGFAINSRAIIRCLSTAVLCDCGRSLLILDCFFKNPSFKIKMPRRAGGRVLGVGRSPRFTFEKKRSIMPLGDFLGFFFFGFFFMIFFFCCCCLCVLQHNVVLYYIICMTFMTKDVCLIYIINVPHSKKKIMFSCTLYVVH